MPLLIKNGRIIIDPHVHLDISFMGTFSSDTHETGTRGALHGGTTTVIDFVLQKHGRSLKEALTQWNSRADGTTAGDYSFHMGSPCRIVRRTGTILQGDPVPLLPGGILLSILRSHYPNLVDLIAQFYSHPNRDLLGKPVVKTRVYS